MQKKIFRFLKLVCILVLSLPKTFLLQKREHTRAPLVAVVAAVAVAAAAVLLLLLLLLELLAHKVAVELAQEVF